MNVCPGPYSDIDTESASFGATGLPFSSTETVSTSTTGIHHAAFARCVGFPLLSKQRKMKLSGKSDTVHSSVEPFQSYLAAIVPGCGNWGSWAPGGSCCFIFVAPVFAMHPYASADKPPAISSRATEFI